ncbi:hypothetical protein LOAG_16087, partial [Loa loa]
IHSFVHYPLCEVRADVHTITHNYIHTHMQTRLIITHLHLTTLLAFIFLLCIFLHIISLSLSSLSSNISLPCHRTVIAQLLPYHRYNNNYNNNYYYYYYYYYY